MKFQIAIVFAAFAVCATVEDLQSRVRRMYGDRAGFAELWGTLGAELMSNQEGANTNEEGNSERAQLCCLHRSFGYKICLCHFFIILRVAIGCVI